MQPNENMLFSSTQSFSLVQLFATPWSAVQQSSLSITKYQSLIKLMSIELVMPSNHLISSSVVPFSSHLQYLLAMRDFSNEPVLHRQVAKILEFQLQHQSLQ